MLTHTYIHTYIHYKANGTVTNTETNDEDSDFGDLEPNNDGWGGREGQPDLSKNVFVEKS